MPQGRRKRLPSLVGRARRPVSFFFRFLRLASPYWTSKERWRAGWLTAALVALTVGQVGVPIAINLWSARLFNALEQKQMEAFLLLVAALGLILLANMLITTTHLRVKLRLQLRWRRWLTRPARAPHRRHCEEHRDEAIQPFPGAPSFPRNLRWGDVR